MRTLLRFVFAALLVLPACGDGDGSAADASASDTAAEETSTGDAIPDDGVDDAAAPPDTAEDAVDETTDDTGADTDDAATDVVEDVDAAEDTSDVDDAGNADVPDVADTDDVRDDGGDAADVRADSAPDAAEDVAEDVAADVAADAPDLADAPDVIGTPCREDAECAPVGWCRATMDEGRACVPWAAEGATCGGFTPPWAFERCGPEWSCMIRSPLIADIPGVCGTWTDVDNLNADAGSLDGRVVGLDGYVDIVVPLCTARACPPDDPCCNLCGAEEVLFAERPDDPVLAPSVGLWTADDEPTAYTCGGDDCDPRQRCTLAPGAYRVIGRFRSEERRIFADPDALLPTEF